MRPVLKTAAVLTAVGAALALGLPGTATAGAGAHTGAPVPTEERAAAAFVQKVTLRLASDPGQAADGKGASTANGAEVIQWALSRAANQLWEPEATSDGYYRFESVNSGLCLNVKGGGNDDGAQIIQWTCGAAANEQWKFVPKGTGYQIVARSSGKCLNVQGGVGQGRNLIQYTCTADGAANDVWLPVWETL
ncbi:RICIN domain-containing protein [Streptomyces sp. NPDC048057]|uniref:RICIN domain-containing protein n=1 Tax=Streptomyces sp. NPDC048057 TaxID=3155628 RepID=UPI0033D8ECEC